MPHRRLQLIARYDILASAKIILHCLYNEQPLPQKPIYFGSQEKTKRNQKIAQLHKDGYEYTELAKLFKVSEQRIHQIVRKLRN